MTGRPREPQLLYKCCQDGCDVNSLVLALVLDVPTCKPCYTRLVQRDWDDHIPYVPTHALRLTSAEQEVKRLKLIVNPPKEFKRWKKFSTDELTAILLALSAAKNEGLLDPEATDQHIDQIRFWLHKDTVHHQVAPGDF